MSRYHWRKIDDAPMTLPAVLCTPNPAPLAAEEVTDPTQTPGYTEGYALGEAAGREAGLAQMASETAQLSEALQAALIDLEAVRTSVRDEMYSQLQQVMPRVFHALFAVELATSETLLMQLIRQVLPEAEGPVKVSVAPLIGEHLARMDMPHNIEWEVCHTLKEGELRVVNGEQLFGLSVPENLQLIMSEFLHSELEATHVE